MHRTLRHLPTYIGHCQHHTRDQAPDRMQPPEEQGDAANRRAGLGFLMLGDVSGVAPGKVGMLVEQHIETRGEIAGDVDGVHIFILGFGGNRNHLRAIDAGITLVTRREGGQILKVSTESLKRWEPRIQVESVEVEADPREAEVAKVTKGGTRAAGKGKTKRR